MGIEAEASHYDWLSQYFAAEFTLNGQPLSAFNFNLAMVFFSSGLLIARIFGDRVAAHIGRPRLLLFGTLIGLGGLCWLILTPSYWQGLVASFFIAFGFAFFFPIFCGGSRAAKRRPPCLWGGFGIGYGLGLDLYRAA